MIYFDHVSVTYPAAAAPALADVSLHIPDGDLCLVVGSTGSGKSTILGAVNGLVPHFTGGRLQGSVRVDGRDTARHRPRDLADVVGYVGQNPLNGFVTDTVEDEVAYGMEQLGLSPTAMRKRVEETLDLMGIADLRRRPLADLSGGQQQRVAIASVLAAQPRVLVLDEPTSSLDPTAAQDVLAAITTLVHEVGLTVLLAEHRLERVMQAADSVIWLPGDGSAAFGPPGRLLSRASVVPPLAALARTLGWAEVPLSVREARRRVSTEGIVVHPPAPRAPTRGDSALIATGLRVSYGAIDAVRGVDLVLQAGTVTALMGRNGAGKSSLLWALQGGVSSLGAVSVAGEDPRHLPPQRARRLVSLVPQTASDLLYLATVGAECDQADAESGAAPGTTAALLRRLGIDAAPNRDPRDLSEGQRLALVLAIQLAADPRVVLLDEPTRGLDYATKQHLHEVIDELSASGVAVLISTHDVEFAAITSSRMLIMADGEIIADGDTHVVCTSSPAYAPQMAKTFAPVPVLTPAEVAAGLVPRVPR